MVTSCRDLRPGLGAHVPDMLIYRALSGFGVGFRLTQGGASLTLGFDIATRWGAPPFRPKALPSYLVFVRGATTGCVRSKRSRRAAPMVVYRMSCRFTVWMGGHFVRGIVLALRSLVSSRFARYWRPVIVVVVMIRHGAKVPGPSGVGLPLIEGIDAQQPELQRVRRIVGRDPADLLQGFLAQIRV